MTGHGNLQNFTFSILKVDNNGFQELFIDFLTLYLFCFGGGGGGGVLVQGQKLYCYFH